MPLKSRKVSFPIANPTRKPTSLLRVGTLSGLDSLVRVLPFTFQFGLYPFEIKYLWAILVLRCLLSAH